MRHQSKGPTQRQLRVGEQIRHMIIETLQRGHFQNEILIDAASDVTVSEVRVSPDLKNAKAFVMTLGGENMDDVLIALNESTYYFQKEISKCSNLKFTPKIKFVIDTSFEEVQKIDNILKNL